MTALHTEKTASEKPSRAPGRPITWRDVSACLEGVEARSRAMSQYKAAGFTADDFGHLRLPRETMASVLTQVEDWLESEHPGRKREREVIKVIRRRLEVELEP